MTEHSRINIESNQADNIKRSKKKKKRKAAQKKKLIDTPCERNVNNVIEENISSESHQSDIVVGDEVLSISSYTI